MSLQEGDYTEAVSNYYDSIDEGSRWPGNRGHQLERRVTRTFLERVLGQHDRVLDCCAGTGAYCFELAEKGSSVVAGDISIRNVEALRRHPCMRLLEDIVRLDACDLSRFPDGSFDVVLTLGALYHLQNEGDRMQALRESARVVKPSGYVIVSYLNRYGCFQQGFLKRPSDIDILVEQYHTGIKGVFYRTTPQEIEALCGRVGLKPIFHVAADGFAQACPDKIAALSDEEYERFCALHLETCEDPSVLGSSVHGLFVGRWVETNCCGKATV